jgi:hypothetical protein
VVIHNSFIKKFEVEQQDDNSYVATYKMIDGGTGVIDMDFFNYGDRVELMHEKHEVSELGDRLFLNISEMCGIVDWMRTVSTKWTVLDPEEEDYDDTNELTCNFCASDRDLCECGTDIQLEFLMEHFDVSRSEAKVWIQTYGENEATKMLNEMIEDAR